jgi:hypothetical protein
MSGTLRAFDEALSIPNGTVMRARNSKNTYVLYDHTRRRVPDQNAMMRLLQVNESKVLILKNEDALSYQIYKEVDPLK